MSEELILTEIDKNTEDYIDFFRELIKCESYNPPGNEKNVALKIEEYLKDVDIKCEIFTFGNNRANLLAYLNDNFDKKNLLFNGHMDVVPPGNEEEWKYHPLSATIKRNKIIYGRGATDMKSGLAALIIALKILKKLNLKLSGNLILNAVSDEETGGELGTKWTLENKLKSIKCDFAIIAEPTELKPLPKAIFIGEKGRLEVKLITNGISCHASIPYIGKNAIYMMSEIIENLDRIEDFIPKIDPPISYDELKELISSAFPDREIFEKILNEQPALQNILKSLTTFTKSLNIIKGGIKANVIPDFCEAIIDFRLLPGQNADMVLDGLKKLIRSLGYSIKGQPTGDPKEIFVYIELLHQSEPSLWKNWKNNQALKDFFRILERIYGKKPFYLIYPASADANYYRNNNFCPETICCGPGNAGSAHSTNENIEIQDYINAIKVYTLFAYHFLK
ncbi:MAG: M20 family metallopeptidase [Promethearchaeota archaeon]